MTVETKSLQMDKAWLYAQMWDYSSPGRMLELRGV